jgi:ankyrin repeat protein
MNFKMCIAKFLVIICVLGAVQITDAKNITKTLKSLSEKQDPLFICLISHSSKNQIKKVLNHQNVNVPDKDGITPLHFATANYGVDIAKLFITTGALVDARDKKQRTPLHYAAANGKIEFVRLFLNHGADVNAKDIDQETPLHYAAANAHVRIAQLLLKHHATIDARDINQVTPLFYAVGMGSSELITLLINHGAMIDAQDNKQKTVLYRAISFGKFKIIKLLLDKGASVDECVLEVAKKTRAILTEELAGMSKRRDIRKTKLKRTELDTIIKLLKKTNSKNVKIDKD